MNVSNFIAADRADLLSRNRNHSHGVVFALTNDWVDALGHVASAAIREDALLGLGQALFGKNRIEEAATEQQTEGVDYTRFGFLQQGSGDIRHANALPEPAIGSTVLPAAIA